MNEDLVDLFTTELEMCKLKPSETVAVLSTPERRTTHLGEYAPAFIRAAQRLGADAFEVSVPRKSGGTGRGRGAYGAAVGTTPLSGVPSAMAALKETDLIIDLMLLIHSPEQAEILESGARMLLVQEPPEVLARNLPSEDLRRRVEKGGAKLKAARSMHVTSPAGTDITFQFGQFDRCLEEYGYTDSPGRWDHWPSGMVARFADDDGVNGQVVAAPGDLLFPLKRYIENPLTFTVESGRIVNIEGGAEAVIVRHFMEQWNDPDVYGLSHIGWGLNKTGLWTAVATTDMQDTIGMEQHCADGDVLFSTGPNIEAGGTRRTACHLDLPLLGCTMTLDGESVVVDGKVVE